MTYIEISIFEWIILVMAFQIIEPACKKQA